jgi:Tol biopolymer transport system component
MGEVYRARDTKLGRDVAIKILPELFAADPERIARFEREAKTLASLNHPNIGGIYGLEHADPSAGSGQAAVRALVLELVEGPTVAEKLAELSSVKSQVSGLPLDEALAIARQIAEALEAAHERGIIHRDLKPANIKLRPDGTVKVLDFGLAKLAHPDAAAVPIDATASPTITSPAMMTGVGVLLGTAAYMSPEQAKGREADKRSDIWAFGCVLYEMVTGRRLFHGEDITETIAAVVKDQPDFAQVPAPLRRLLKSCLEKDPKKRLQAIGDMRLLLEDAAPPMVAPSRQQLGTAAWAVAGAAVLAAAFLAFIHFRETPPAAPVVRSTILPPANTTLDFPQGVGLPALSPDGQRIVFGAQTADGKRPLWVRALDGLTAQSLAGTEGAAFPFWSPDSRFIAFFADGKLKKIDASGGPALTLADARLGRGGSWNRDGVIVFAPGVGDTLQRVPSAGGASSPVSTIQGSFPWFLPDGRHIVYQAQRNAINVGSLDGAPSQALGTGSNALYAQGHLLFLREDTLLAQPFDTRRLATAGEAVPVAERVQTVLDSGRVGAFSVSETGLLAYREGAASRGGILTWFDRSGKRGTAVGEAARQTLFEFSPDRTRVAAVVQDQAGAGEDVWIYDVARGLRTRFTFDAARDTLPVWSPDGHSIVFSSNRKGNFDLYRKAVDSVAAEELLYADDLNKRPTSWSADGKLLLYDAIEPKTGRDIWVLPLPERPGVAVKPSLVLQTAFNEADARFSADGRWILYSSDESQRYEVYVTPFPLAPAGPGGKRQVSTSGVGPVGGRWRQDGREIFYVSQDRRLMATEVAIKGGTLEAGAVRSPFSLISEGGNVGLASFEVTADGQRFLVSTTPEQQSAEPLTLILNWASGLNK